MDGGDKGGGEKTEVTYLYITIYGHSFNNKHTAGKDFFNRSGFSCSYYLVSTIINYHYKKI
jgi:hypothetical protein